MKFMEKPMLMKLAIFYLVGAVIVGALMAGSQTVNATYRGKPVTHPRLIAGVVGGALWPVTLIQSVFARLK